MNDAPKLELVEKPLTDAELEAMSTEELQAVSEELGKQIVGDTEAAEELVAGIEEIGQVHDAAVEQADGEMDNVHGQMQTGIDEHNLAATRATLGQ
ncbi:hypothetical protein BH11PAT4_BH11PAT4_7980 [soil metagenome]